MGLFKKKKIKKLVVSDEAMRRGLAFSTPTPVVQRAMFWCSRQSIDLISHSVKILIYPALNYIDISFYFPIKRYESQLMEPPFSFSCLLRLWLNHEFGGFWFQGEAFLSTIFGKQIPQFRLYVHLMSFSSLSHVTNFCLAPVKTLSLKMGNTYAKLHSPYFVVLLWLLVRALECRL